MMAEIALAVVPIVESCFKHGKTLADLCATFRGAEGEIAERSLRIGNYWERASVKLRYFDQIEDQLAQEHRDLLLHDLAVLDHKLLLAGSELSHYVEIHSGRWRLTRNIKKVRYVFMKEKLDGIIDDLEKWDRMFRPAFFLTARSSSHKIDEVISGDMAAHDSAEELSSVRRLRSAVQGDADSRKNVFRSGEKLKSGTSTAIPLSSARLAHLEDGYRYIVDTTICPPAATSSRIVEDVRTLAGKLRLDESSFGLLTCRGVVKHVEDDKPKSFDFLFRPPEDSAQPQSLRQALTIGDASHSLSDRFNIAKQLAMSIGHIHTFGFVHKNVRPETILLFSNAPSLGSAYLLGFENFRSAEGKTYRLGDGDWERNLYRHPARHGAHPEEDYIMQHDIYSLGVCLLEVGLWETLVQYHGSESNPSRSSLLGPAEDMEAWAPQAVKRRLVALAREVLPRRMGTMYGRVVETCLTCLDENNVDFGDEKEFKDEDGVLVGVRYIEKILVRLDSLAV